MLNCYKYHLKSSLVKLVLVMASRPLAQVLRSGNAAPNLRRLLINIRQAVDLCELILIADDWQRSCTNTAVFLGLWIQLRPSRAQNPIDS